MVNCALLHEKTHRLLTSVFHRRIPYLNKVRLHQSRPSYLPKFAMKAISTAWYAASFKKGVTYLISLSSDQLFIVLARNEAPNWRY